MRDLRRTHDDLIVQVLRLETREAIEAVQAGGADVAVVLRIVLPSGHRLARRDEVPSPPRGRAAGRSPARHPGGAFRTLVERLCAQAGSAPLVAYELDDLPAARPSPP